MQLAVIERFLVTENTYRVKVAVCAMLYYLIFGLLNTKVLEFTGLIIQDDGREVNSING